MELNQNDPDQFACSFQSIQLVKPVNSACEDNVMFPLVVSGQEKIVHLDERH